MANCVKVFESIRITHYINPHMFWFRTVNSFYYNDSMLDLEHKLMEYFRTANALDDYEFQIGDMAAVYVQPWQKWVRVVLDDYVTILDNTIKCIVWAVDMGFPIECSSKRLKPIPRSLATVMVQPIYYAGLNCIVPAEKIYELTASYTLKIIPINEWCDYAISEMKRLINNAANIQFTAQLVNGNANQMFGRLKINQYCGTIIDVNEYLVSLSVGLQVQRSEFFLRRLSLIHSIQKQRYQTNENMVQSADLNYDGKISGNKQIVPDLYSHRDVRDNIFDWFRQNAYLRDDDECASLAYPFNIRLNYRNTARGTVTVLPILTHLNYSYVNAPPPVEEATGTQSDGGASSSQNVENRPESPVHLVGYDSN